MRTMRVSLVWTVMLALLGGMSPAVAAQTEAGSDVSGTAVYIDGVLTYEYGELENIMVSELSMSDSRASGQYTMFHPDGDAYDSQSRRPTEVGFRRVALANDEGSWSGLQSALWHDEIGWRFTAWLAGEGSHEGLSLYLHGQRFPIYNLHTMDFDGIIFDGTAPAMVEALQPPAE